LNDPTRSLGWMGPTTTERAPTTKESLH